MHLQKRLIAIFVVVLLLAGAFYAGGLGIRAVEKEEISEWYSNKETIYFWYTDEELSNYINSAAVSFGNKEDVRVIPILTEDNHYLEEINQQSLHSEQIPDAYIISNDSLEKAYLAGLTCKISDETGICDTEHFSEAAINAVTYKNKMVAYPFYFDTSVLVYNKSYLQEWARQQAHKELSGVFFDPENDTEEDAADTQDEQPLDEAEVERKASEYFVKAIPQTVDDLLHVADSFDVPEGVEGIMKWDVSDIFCNYWLVGNYFIIGGEHGDSEKDIDIENEQTITCLETYKGLNQFFSIEADNVSAEMVLQDFIDGKLVFTIASTGIVNRLAEAVESGQMHYEYGFANMPMINKELDSRSLSVTNTVAINGYSEHKELANRFAAYLTDEYVDELYERSGKLAANKNVNTQDSNLLVFMQEYARSVSLPKMMEIGNLWLQLEVLFSKVWNGAEVTPLVQELAEQLRTQIQVDE